MARASSVADPSGPRGPAYPGCLERVPDTYDTFKCLDCGSSYSGYLRGHPHLGEHLYRGGGLCRTVLDRFRGDETKMLQALGKARFQRGRVANPRLCSLTESGYRANLGARSCVVCNAAREDPWHMMACPKVNAKLREFLTRARFLDPDQISPLDAAERARSRSEVALGRERFELGMVAFPEAFEFCVFGSRKRGGDSEPSPHPKHCIVCARDHSVTRAEPACLDMYVELVVRIRNMVLLR